MQLISANIGNSSTSIAVDHSEHAHRWLFESVVRRSESINFDFEEIEELQDPAYWAVCSVNRT